MPTVQSQPQYPLKYQKTPQSLQTSCASQRFLSLAKTMSKLSLQNGKTHHPSRVLLLTNSNQLKSKKVNNDGTNGKKAKTNTKKSGYPEQVTTNSCSRVSQLISNDVTTKRQPDSDETTQLLHPDWRKVPWKHYFGWTDAHKELCKRLQLEARKGNVENIYYGSQEEYMAAGLVWRYHHRDSPFLRGPSANSVSEVLEVMRKINNTRSHCLYSSRLARWSKRNNLTVTGYEADVED